VAETLRLLWGTVVHRPYVWAFFACFVVFAFRHLGALRAVAFTVTTWTIAFAAEYSSTRNGFPFGPYDYFDGTRGQELWISNVPFWDSLSFVFLSYFSFVLAAAMRTPASGLGETPWPGLRARSTPLVGGALMMLLDVVIDPVTLQGEKWFLGRIYAYPSDGFWFGVTAANFAGWFAVGVASQWVFQRCLAWLPGCRGPWRPAPRLLAWGAFGVYAGVLAFMLAVTAAIHDGRLLLASGVVSAVTLAVVALSLRRSGATAAAAGA
jgi:putative membrane protein